MKHSLAIKPHQSPLTEQPLPHNGKIPEEGKIIPINTHLLQEQIKLLTSNHCGENGKFSCGRIDDGCHRKVRAKINESISDERIKTFGSSDSIASVVRFAIKICMGEHHLEQQERQSR